jgi:hypothetical protein
MMSSVVIMLLVALSAYAGRMYQRKSGTGSDKKNKELDDAIKKVQSDLSTMSDADLIRSISEHGTVDTKEKQKL